MGMRKALVLFISFIALCNPSFAIKIGLQTGVNKTYIGASTKAEIINCDTNKLIYVMEKMKGYEMKPYHDVIAIKVDGKWNKMRAGKIIIKPEEGGFVSVKRRWYRGNFKIINDGMGLTVINDVPIDKYRSCVVPSEMPSGWEHEAH